MRNFIEFNKGLFDFISQSGSSFHATSLIKSRLLDAGFKELKETQSWQISKGKGYFVVRDSGSIIAFTKGIKKEFSDGFQIVGGHTDSPSLQIKPTPLIENKNNLSLGVEVYGCPLLGTWFDRDLSLAGRVYILDQNDKLQELLIDFKRPLLTIPSLAIHLDREANSNRTINAQKDIVPILSKQLNEQPVNFEKIIKEQVHTQYNEIVVEKVLSFELFCYDTQEPVYTGLNKDFISASRLDNLLSCYSGLEAMIQAGFETNMMLLCYNHEEIGSTTLSGADGAFVEAIFERLIQDSVERRICFANSFHISMDNAHASHPNYPEKSDPQHHIEMNEGVVIKNNSKQRYASNGYSSSFLKFVAEKAQVNTQEFVMRSDMACGSTIGSMTAAKLGIATVDIGAPTLGMHSIREITGAKDPFDLYSLCLEFYKTSYKDVK